MVTVIHNTTTMLYQRESVYLGLVDCREELRHAYTYGGSRLELASRPPVTRSCIVTHVR